MEKWTPKICMTQFLKPVNVNLYDKKVGHGSLQM